jgi:hypothetical protein
MGVINRRACTGRSPPGAFLSTLPACAVILPPGTRTSPHRLVLILPPGGYPSGLPSALLGRRALALRTSLGRVGLDGPLPPV